MSQQQNASLALIRRAVEKAGSNRALAQVLNAPDSSVSFWLKGSRPIPDAVLAEIAAYLGEDPLTALASASGGRWEKVAAIARRYRATLQNIHYAHRLIRRLRRLRRRLHLPFAV